MTEAQFTRAVSVAVMDRRLSVHPSVAALMARVQTLKYRLFPRVHAARSIVFAGADMTTHTAHARKLWSRPGARPDTMTSLHRARHLSGVNAGVRAFSGLHNNFKDMDAPIASLEHLRGQA